MHTYTNKKYIYIIYIYIISIKSYIYNIYNIYIYLCCLFVILFIGLDSFSMGVLIAADWNEHLNTESLAHVYKLVTESNDSKYDVFKQQSSLLPDDASKLLHIIMQQQQQHQQQQQQQQKQKQQINIYIYIVNKLNIYLCLLNTHTECNTYL